MSELRAERIAPPSRGIDSESGPDAVQRDHAPLLENWLPQRGKLRMRGPLRRLGTPAYPAADPPPITMAAWRSGATVLLAGRQSSGTAIRDPWTTHYRPTADTNALTVGSPALASQVLGGAAAAAAHSGDANHRPGPFSAKIGGTVWGIGLGATDFDTTNSARALARTRLLRWNGQAVNDLANGNWAGLAVDTVAPQGAQYLISHYNRLLVLGGTEPAATPAPPIEPNTLYLSDPGGPVANTLASWQDDVSGFVNKIVVGEDGDDDFLVAAARVGRDLVLFKRYNIYLLVGYSPSTFTVRQLVTGYGCIDPRSVVETEAGCFFMSQHGYMLFDGSRFTTVSAPEQSAILGAALQRVGDDGDDGGYVASGVLPGSGVMLSIGRRRRQASDEEENDYWGLYDYRTDSWTRLSSAADGVAGAHVYFGVAAGPSSIGVARAEETLLYDASAINAPEAVPLEERGADDNDPVTTGPARTAIPAVYRSRFVRLASPLYRAQMHRLLLDYRFVVPDSTDDEHDGLKVSLIGGDGSVIVPEFSVPSMGVPSSFLARRRHTQDTYAEVVDAQLVVRWEVTSGEPPACDAEVYDADLEYQVTRQRRSS